MTELAPGSYSHLPAADQAFAFQTAFDCLSCMMLTSVGYGSIVPVNPVA